MIILLMFIAPVIQIALSILRYHHKIALPIGIIMVLMLVFGYGLSIWIQSGFITPFSPQRPPELHPSMPMVLYFGFMITTFTVIPIGIFACVVYYFRPE
jgi:hypothetical protein